MKTYSDFVDRVFLQEDFLRKLIPQEPSAPLMVRRIREADDAIISGGRSIGDASTFALIRGGLYYAVDAIHEGHGVFQEASGDLGAYWHGMIHRREGDFENARYWFRRAGKLAFFDSLHRAACEHSAVMARQPNWDPYLFTGECEQARFGAEEGVKGLAALQLIEFEGVFDYCWRKSALG